MRSTATRWRLASRSSNRACSNACVRRPRRGRRIECESIAFLAVQVRRRHFIIFRFASTRPASLIGAFPDPSVVLGSYQEAAMEQPDSSATQPPNQPAKRGTNVPVPFVVGVICLGLGMAGGIVVGQSIPDRSKVFNDPP